MFAPRSDHGKEGNTRAPIFSQSNKYLQCPEFDNVRTFINVKHLPHSGPDGQPLTEGEDAGVHKARVAPSVQEMVINILIRLSCTVCEQRMVRRRTQSRPACVTLQCNLLINIRTC